MKRIARLIFLSAMGACSLCAVAKKNVSVDTSADQPRQFQQLLWQGEAPHVKVIKPDAEGNLRAPQNIGDTAKVFVFLPAPSKATGKAVVLCPGGGYGGVCIGHEGVDWAPFFNEEGVALVVLQYRLPEGDKYIPIEDVQEAIRLTRRHAEEWHINPNAIGVGGSSAGGHLASTASTHFNAPINADAVSCRPDFSILFYPVISLLPQYTHEGTRRNLLGPNSTPEEELFYCNELQVTTETPRAWIAFSDDDDIVPTPNGLIYYEALHKLNIPVSLHIYPSGKHGWGSLSGFLYHSEMESDLRSWLKSF
jgi:acetyl esterase/lipase